MKSQVIAISFIAFLVIIQAMQVKYSFQGMQSDQFSTILHKYPLSSLIRALQNMGNNSQLLLRPFNFGSTKSYEDHTGLGKNTNVKGKSCNLKDENLNGKITYIQSNEYTGRNQPQDKITYIGKYLDLDRLIIPIFKDLAAKNCQRWKNISTDQIKIQIANEIKYKAKENPNAQAAANYVNQRLMFKPTINNETYLTTEFVVPKNVTTKQIKLNKVKQVCQDGHCHYLTANQLTNQVEVLAYQALDLDKCKFVQLQLVADMDIFTINFPYEDSGQPVDLYQYIDDPTGQNCKNSFKYAFGISPDIKIIYDYIYKLMNATSQWGLIRHSMQALNLCFTQPYEKQKYYLILKKTILGNGQITVVWEGKDSKIIQDEIRQWVLKGQCTPINPYWLFTEKSKQPAALLWTSSEQVNSILESKKFKENKCPTYDLIKKIVDSKKPKDIGGKSSNTNNQNQGNQGNQGNNQNRIPWWAKPVKNLRHQINRHITQRSFHQI